MPEHCFEVCSFLILLCSVCAVYVCICITHVKKVLCSFEDKVHHHSFIEFIKPCLCVVFICLKVVYKIMDVKNV